MTQEELLEKYKVLVAACKAYYIDSVPTGMLDSEYDELEIQAAREGFFVRDYIFNKYSKGNRIKNQYIEKVKKTKVEGKTMLEAILDFKKTYGKDIYCDLKYDGSSIAIYLDPATGKPRQVSTCGNLNLSSEQGGTDQTWKILKYLPKQFPKGIVAIQCEALVDVNRMPPGSDKDRARQKSNGLVNSTKMDDEIAMLLTLRAYRYYTDDSPAGIAIKGMDYREVLKSFPIVRSRIDGHFQFAPADVWTPEELQNKPEGFTETDCIQTSTGKFLADGMVMYSTDGICLGALKFAGAGSGTELIKTTVKSIQWNNQVSKGKDSWSANVIVEPIEIRGCTVKKPSAGSVDKLVKEKITPGAEVTLVLANSTIPMIGKTLKPGNGDYQWPTCSCGHVMSEKDVFGSLLKCSNPDCSERKDRMRKYLSTISSPSDLDLNKFLVIDRFKWETTDVDLAKLLDFVKNEDPDSYKEYLMSFMGTALRKRNMEVVWKASYITLHEKLAGH
jgi:hypothetical protein